MKKNFFWIAALFAALALVFAGCTDGADDPDEFELDWYIGTLETVGEDEVVVRHSSKTITLTPNEEDTDYVRIYWEPTGKNFTGIRVTFTVTESVNVSWLLVWGEEGMRGGFEYIDYTTGTTITTTVSKFTDDWGDGSGALDPKTMYGICIAVAFDEDFGGSVDFTVTNFELTGLN